MRTPRLTNRARSWLVTAIITAAVAVTVPFGADVAVAAPAFPNFGSSGGSSDGDGPAVGEVRVGRTIKWELPRSNSAVMNWKVSVDPDDRKDQAGWGRQCVNSRTEGFGFLAQLPSDRGYSRSDDLSMLASQSFPFCASKESIQTWFLTVDATSGDGRYVRTWRSRIDYRYISGNLRVYVISQSSPTMPVTLDGSDIRVAPEF